MCVPSGSTLVAVVCFRWVDHRRINPPNGTQRNARGTAVAQMVPSVTREHSMQMRMLQMVPSAIREQPFADLTTNTYIANRCHTTCLLHQVIHDSMPHD